MIALTQPPLYSDVNTKFISVVFLLLFPFLHLLHSSLYFLLDHCVHYYDLRNTKQPIMVFKGHRKAVSYAKFVSGEEIVSA